MNIWLAEIWRSWRARLRRRGFLRPAMRAARVPPMRALRGEMELELAHITAGGRQRGTKT